MLMIFSRYLTFWARKLKIREYCKYHLIRQMLIVAMKMITNRELQLTLVQEVAECLVLQDLVGVEPVGQVAMIGR